MLSLKLRRGLAGLGVFAIGGLGLLAPTAAMADPPSFTDPNAVKLNKTLISNESIFPYSVNVFHFQFTPTKCGENGCVDEGDIPDIDGQNGLTVNLTGSGSVYTGSRTFLPTDPSSAYPHTGIYAWSVSEVFASTTPGAPQAYAMSGATYLVRAAIKQGDSGLEYNWITITQLTDDKGDPVNEKVDSLDFVNVAEDVGDIEVTKTVTNNSGVTEQTEPYEIQVVFNLPDNFNGVADATTGKFTTTTPTISFATGNEATDLSCTTANKVTTCRFKLAATSTTSKTAKLTGIPAGSTYTVTEISTGNYETTIAPNNGNGTVPVHQWDAGGAVPAFPPPTTQADCNALAAAIEAGERPDLVSATWVAATETGECRVVQAPVMSGPAQVSVVVTNKYNDVTPTGLVLEYLPYVLMVVIPLGGIGAYVAMRRKLLS